MAKIPDQFALGQPQWSSPTAVPKYDEKAMAAPGKAQAQVGEAISQMGKSIGGALSAFAEVGEQTNKYETARKFVDFDMQQSDQFVEAERNMAPDGTGFRESIASGYDARAREFFKNVPDSLKPEYDYKLRQRARDYEQRGRDIEYKQRDTYHINDLNTQAQGFIEKIQADPNSITDNVGRFKFITENSRLQPDRKDAMIREFGAKAEAAHIKARIEAGDDPEQIQADIMQRIRPAWDSTAKMKIAPTGRPPGIRRLGGPVGAEYEINEQTPAQSSTQANDPISTAARTAGIDPIFMRAVAEIESGGDPSKQTGSYKGLFQLSEAQFRQYGGTGSVSDPAENAKAAAAKFIELTQGLEKRLGREPTSGEVYLAHQQGLAGATSHLKNPDAPAWQNMQKAASSSEQWAKRAIWGNLTPEAKRQFGSVDKVTSRQFAEFWGARVDQFENKALGSEPARGGNQMVASAEPIQSAAGGSVPVKGGSAMSVAKMYLGAHESRDAEALGSFFKKAGGQKLNPADTAWCAAFVNAALGASGQKGTGTLAARDFLKLGAATSKPSDGDIVVLSRGDPNGWQGHVGFYAGRDSKGNILVLGGNQGNKVSVQAFPEARVLGYRRPPDAGTEIPGISPPQLSQGGTSGYSASGSSSPAPQRARDSGFKTAEWLMDSYQWGSSPGGYADMKNPQQAPSRRAPSTTTTTTTQATAATPGAKVSEPAPGPLSAADALAALKDYEDTATLADLPPDVRAKVLPKDKTGNEKVGNTQVGDVRRLLEGQLPPSEGHATAENSSPGHYIDGKKVAGVNNQGRVQTLLDGIPDDRPLSQLPEDVRREVMGLMPEDAQKQRTMPDGRKVSAADVVTVGEVKEAFAAPLQDPAKALPAAKHTYRWLPTAQAEKLLRDMQIAQRNKFIGEKGEIAGEAYKIAKTGVESRDKNGLTVLERAAKVLLPNQMTKARQDIEVGHRAFAQIAPIPTLPDHELETYAQRFQPEPGDTPDEAAMKRVLLRSATTAINDTRALRKSDIARASNESPEVKAAYADILQQSKIAEGAGTSVANRRVSHWEKIIDARIEVQRKIFDGEESSVRTLTKPEAYKLMGIGQPADWKTLDPKQQRARLEEAAKKADRDFGKHARAAMTDAIKIVVHGDEDRREASAITNKLIRGEPITAMDAHRFRMLDALSPSEVFMTAGRDFRMAPPPKLSPIPNMPAQPSGFAAPNMVQPQAQKIGPSAPPAQGAGRFSAPALRGQPQGQGQAEPMPKTRSVDIPQANAAAFEWLSSNPTANSEAFDRRFGPGAAKTALDWWATRGGARGAKRAENPGSGGFLDRLMGR